MSAPWEFQPFVAVEPTMTKKHGPTYSPGTYEIVEGA